jgi:hypothetical protein
VVTRQKAEHRYTNRKNLIHTNAEHTNDDDDDDNNKNNNTIDIFHPVVL